MAPNEIMAEMMLCGQDVALYGLSRPELNGKRGKALKWEAPRGRMVVDVPSFGRMLIKPTNLRVASTFEFPPSFLATLPPHVVEALEGLDVSREEYEALVAGAYERHTHRSPAQAQAQVQARAKDHDHARARVFQAWPRRAQGCESVAAWPRSLTRRVDGKADGGGTSRPAGMCGYVWLCSAL